MEIDNEKLAKAMSYVHKLGFKIYAVPVPKTKLCRLKIERPGKQPKYLQTMYHQNLSRKGNIQQKIKETYMEVYTNIINYKPKNQNICMQK